MPAPVEEREALLQRTPIYKAVFSTVRLPEDVVPVATVGYFPSGYFASGYFPAGYWPGSGTEAGLVIGSSETTDFSTHKIRIRRNEVDETDTVDEAFSIDETKEYGSDLDSFYRLNHSPLGDMFGFDETWGTSDAMPLMKIPSTTAPMQIYPEQGLCSVGAVLLEIADIDESMTDLVGLVLYGQQVVIWRGFHDIDEDDFIIAYKGTVQSLKLSSDLAGYEIQIHNAPSLVNKQLFQAAASYLNFAIDEEAEVFSVPVEGVGFFQDSGYVFIDYELIQYEAREFATFVFLTRGAWGTLPTPHAANAVVQEAFVLGPAHPVDIILGIYYGTPSKTCLGLGYHDIDWLAFARARAVIGTDARMQFFVTEAANAMDWLSSEIFLPLGCYPFATADGRLSIKAFSPAAAPVVTFDHGSILANNGKLEMSWGLGAGNIGQPINDVTINYDQNPIDGSFYSYYREVRDQSILNYGRFPVVINASGLRFNLFGTQQLILDRVAAILDRYEDGAPVINIRTHLQKQAADVGEAAALTSRLIPNRVTSRRGVAAATTEIINRAINWESGNVDWTLLGADPQL